MSAERLREAANVLRERAEAATAGPWLRAGGSRHIFGREVGDEVAQLGRAFDAAYIATVDPVFGLAAAAWLEKYAALVADSRKTNRPAFGDLPHALAVADAILGPTEGGER